MKRMIELLKYEVRIYFKSSRFVMPLIVLLLFIYLMNSSKSANIEGEFAITCYVVFCLMAWVGFTLPACEDAVMEQIQFLRVKGSPFYFAAKIAALAFIGLLSVGICMIHPVLEWIAGDMCLFDRPLAGYDVLAAALLFAACSFAGGALGGFLHPGVMKNRKMATMLTTLFVLLVVIKKSITGEIPFLNYLLWIFPSVDKAAGIYRGWESYGFAQICGIICMMLLYGAVYSGVRCVVCYYFKS